jgi:hypothetical protein
MFRSLLALSSGIRLTTKNYTHSVVISCYKMCMKTDGFICSSDVEVFFLLEILKQ